MKNLLLPFLLIAGTVAFGQSAKKQNVQLRNELTLAKESYQAAKRKYNDEKLRYASSVLVPLVKKMQKMVDEISRNEVLKKETFNDNETLKLLLGKTTEKAVYNNTIVSVPFEDRLNRINSSLEKALGDKSEPGEVQHVVLVTAEGPHIVNGIGQPLPVIGPSGLHPVIGHGNQLLHGA